MTSPSRRLSDELVLAFEPLHKRALGMSIGLATGLLFFLATAVSLLRPHVSGPDLRLLAEYFYGYTVSWGGAFVALAWGFVAGFACALLGCDEGTFIDAGTRAPFSTFGSLWPAPPRSTLCA